MMLAKLSVKRKFMSKCPPTKAPPRNPSPTHFDSYHGYGLPDTSLADDSSST